MERERRQCECKIPDPVMQADRRFYCHTCSFQVAAVLCEQCQAVVRAPVSAVPAAPDDVLDVYVPGAWKCLQCGFALSKATIFMQSGTIGYSRDDVMRMEGESCPNDGTLMVRETWHDRAESNRKWGESLMEEIIAATSTDNLPAALEAVKSRAAAPALVKPEAPQSIRNIRLLEAMRTQADTEEVIALWLEARGHADLAAALRAGEPGTWEYPAVPPDAQTGTEKP